MASKQPRYDEDFKKSLVALYNNGKSQTSLCKEYGVSQTALAKWIKQYSSTEICNTRKYFWNKSWVPSLSHC